MCKVFKVYLSVSDIGTYEDTEIVFWAYSFDDVIAEQAALRWANNKFPHKITEVLGLKEIKRD